MPYKDPEKRRACARKSARKSYTANPEKFRQRRRTAYAVDPEKERAATQKWRQEHPDKAKATTQQWRDMHPDKARESQQKTRKKHGEKYNRTQAAKRRANPEAAHEKDKRENKRRKTKVQAWGIVYRAKKKALRAQMTEDELYHVIQKTREYQRLYQSGRRARKRSLPATFTREQEQFMRQYWQYACAICGRQEGFEWFLALDHWIAITSPECPGTVVTNMLPLCHGIGGCNNLKLNQDGTIWLRERYGIRKAAKILKTIEAYFAIVHTNQEAPPGVA